jgi:triosephosphate isomerase
MRNRIIAGNWKMFTTLQQGEELVKNLNNALQNADLSGKQVIVIPPFTHIASLSKQLGSSSSIALGAQNCYFEKEGAFTGEISTAMIRSCGAKYVIIGHSERRQYFHETNQILAKKVDAVLADDLTPIYCCGETLEERESNNHFAVIEKQVSEGLFHLSDNEFGKVVIAYEPVWAIGTGKTASAEQAQEVHAFIRSLIEKKYGNEPASKTIILYGGSVKPNNAAELFNQTDIDGGLVGGASLKAEDFAGIINA